MMVSFMVIFVACGAGGGDDDDVGDEASSELNIVETALGNGNFTTLVAALQAADLDDEESLVRALSGAYGAFFVTNFWEHFSPEREATHARNMAAAAKAAGLPSGSETLPAIGPTPVRWGSTSSRPSAGRPISSSI